MRSLGERRLATAGFLVVLSAVLCAGQALGATFTRRPYLNSVTEQSAEVLFQLDTACAVTVRYGPGGQLTQTASGVSSKTHSVRLTGLTAGTQYSYQVEACGAPVGDVDTFQAASPARTMKVRFSALGDMGVASSTQARIAEQMRATKPEFWVGTGDLAYSSGTASEFSSRFFKPMAEMLEDVPTFPSMGNHEYQSDDAQPYLDTFTLPTNNPQKTERYYSFDWGPVHFVSLDTECVADYDSGTCDGAAQVAWLRADLAASTRPWKIVFFHRPAWSSGSHGSNTKVRNLLSPVFEEHGVDLVLAGHDHNYERSKKVRGNSVDEAKGITHVVVGSGGATLRPFSGSTPSWTAYRNDTDYGFLDVVIDGGTLTGKFIKDDGKVLDTFTITKQVAMPEEPTLTVVAEPASGTVPLRTTLNAQTNLESPTFSWALPDGSTATGNPVNLELTTPGNYVATVSATGGGTTLTQTVAIAANEANCEATNTCVVPDAGPGPGGGGPGGGGDDDIIPPYEPEPSGCAGNGALLLPLGLLGLALRRRRSA